MPLRRATWKMQKAVLITNFVDRESERPLIGASDFCNSPGVHSNADVNVSNAGTIKKKMRYLQRYILSLLIMITLVNKVTFWCHYEMCREQLNSENQVDFAPRYVKITAR